jgi:RNA polymerase sigma-70 factor, ECF subfamily
MDNADLRSQLEKLHPESYGWALSCCRRDPADAEGILQDVYLKILEGRARYDARSSLKTWLFSVIRRTAAEHRRASLLRRLRLGNDPPAIEPSAIVESADESVYRSELQMLFTRALRALPSRQREVMQLVFYHELSLQEASGVMGVSIGSARTHYDRGKKQLRKLMVESGVFDEAESTRADDQAALPALKRS